MAVMIRFGKHEGKTVEYIFFNDPGYIYWMVEEGIHEDPKKFSPAEQNRIKVLLRRAAHIKVPGLCTWCKQRPVTRMFLTMHHGGGLAKADFDCEKCSPEGSVSLPVNPGFWTPDIFRNYDKTGAKFLIHSVKFAFFQDVSYRMTEKRVEEFWENPDHFVNF